MRVCACVRVGVNSAHNGWKWNTSGILLEFSNPADSSEDSISPGGLVNILEVISAVGMETE